MASQPSKAVGIYPGSFDPLTSGHADLIARASKLVDTLIVAILHNSDKKAMFTVEERIEMIREAVPLTKIQVESFDGLLVDFAARRNASVIFRGIRAVSDYEYELQMALMNRRLNPDVETVFLLPGEAYSFVSSRLVKEVARLGGDIAGLAPPNVVARLKQRFQEFSKQEIK